MASAHVSIALSLSFNETTGSFVDVDDDWSYWALASFTSLPSSMTEPLAFSVSIS